MGQSFSFLCGACRIFSYQLYKLICCVPKTQYLPIRNTICVGLSEVGKSRMLAALNKENLKTEPTIGFNVKAVKLRNCILNIKELGGGDGVRKFWSKYFVNTESIIMVMKLSKSINISKNILIQKQELSTAFNLHIENGYPLLIILSYELISESEEALSMIHEVLGQFINPGRSLVLLVDDVVKDSEKIRETLEIFCFKFLLN